jgi:predicted lipoprotein with Yx(FWY)xxD motif
MRTGKGFTNPRSARSSRLLVAGALGVVLLAATACSSGGAASSTSSTSARGSSTAGTSGSVSVALAKIGSFGTVLVNGSGRTIYRYTPDGTGKSVCNGSCDALWPPLTVPAGTTRVTGGAGVSSADLGVIMRSDGTQQVTYKGMPVYTYVGDTKAGQASGQGILGRWFVVSTSATSSAAAPTSPAGTSAQSNTTTTKASGGYGY